MTGSSQPEKSPGFVKQWAREVKLTFNLLGDKKVSILLKMFFIACYLGTLVYVLVPDFLPGPLDDFLGVWIVPYILVELAPHDVVKEHLEKMDEASRGTSRDD